MDINNKFIKQYKDLIYSLIHKAGVKDTESINKLFSNIIIRMIEHNNYDEDLSSPSTWITLVSRSEISNYIRARGNSKDALDQTILPIHVANNKSTGSEGDELTIRELINRIKHSRIKPQWKHILIEKHYVGKTNREISEEMGLSYHNVRKIAVRALKQLEGEESCQH